MTTKEEVRKKLANLFEKTGNNNLADKLRNHFKMGRFEVKYALEILKMKNEEICYKSFRRL